MDHEGRLCFLDNLRTFLIFLVVLVHSGVVYESSGLMAPYWIVDDPMTSDLPGLVNLILDLFVMPTVFFISGFFTPPSLERRGSIGFITAKVRRLIVPWILALFTLIPIYNAIFLYSRGLSQGPWTAYFHFSNSTISMNWLWFLPVLFLFDVLYVVLNFFLKPGEFIISARVDGLVFWLSLYVSMLFLLYCAVTTFKYFKKRQRRLGAILSKLSYNVYIIHLVVLGPIALALLRTDFPALVKYPILTLTTYAVSTMIVFVYAKLKVNVLSQN
jgi:hypothetical protein